MSNKEIEVSVIMPVYNSEKYVRNAAESIIRQTYKNFELIMVDDGSTDQSGKICDDLAKLDSRICVIHKENGGICSARNAGLNNVQGKYIMFIDNDDEYEKNCLETAVQAIEDLGTDIVRFNCRRILYFSSDRKKEEVYGTLGICEDRETVWTQRELYENYFLMMKSGALLGVWDGIYKRELFDSIRFDESMKYGYEDHEMNLHLYSTAKKVAFIPEVLYMYNKRESHSVSAKFHPNYIESIVKIANLERKFLLEHDADNEILLVMKAFYLEHAIRSLYKKCPYTIKKKIEIMRSLRKEPAFSAISTHYIHLSRRFPYYVVNYLFDKEMYGFLYKVSSIVIKLRGNL